MSSFKLILKVCITAMFALIILYVPMLLMILGAKYICVVLGMTQISDTQFLIAILIMAGISFAFCWWFDNKFKIYKTVSYIVDKILKDKES
jgi:hypothetical protein